MIWQALQLEKDWIQKIAWTRFPPALLARVGEKRINVSAIEEDRIPPDLSDFDCSYSRFVYTNKLTYEERLLLAFVFMPHAFPHIYEKGDSPQPSPKFGFLPGIQTRGWIPTGTSYIHLYGGDDINKRSRAMHLLNGEGILFKESILKLSSPIPGEPIFSGKLQMAFAWLQLFLFEQVTTDQHDA